MSSLNPTDLNGVTLGIKGQAQQLADMYSQIVRFDIDLATQLGDNGASLALSAAQQSEVQNWHDNVVHALRNAFEGIAIVTPQSMVSTISQQRPLGR